MRIRAGDKIDSKVFSFYKSHHFSEVANWLLFIKGSKFVRCVYIYPWTVELDRQAVPLPSSHWRCCGHLCLQYPAASGMYCNIFQSRSICIKEVFLAGGCILNGQRTSFASEESHPQRKLKCVKMLNRTVLSAVVVLVRAVDLYPASTGIGCRFRSSRDSTPSVRLSRSWAWLLETPRLCYNSIVI